MDFSFQNCTFYLKFVLQKCCYPEPKPGAGAGAGSRNRSRSRLDRLHNTHWWRGKAPLRWCTGTPVVVKTELPVRPSGEWWL